MAIVESESNVHDAGVRRCRSRRSGPPCRPACRPADRRRRGLERVVDLLDAASRLRLATRSVTEPSGTGTRIATPSILPFSCGSASDVAFAAPSTPARC